MTTEEKVHLRDVLIKRLHTFILEQVGSSESAEKVWQELDVRVRCGFVTIGSDFVKQLVEAIDDVICEEKVEKEVLPFD